MLDMNHEMPSQTSLLALFLISARLETKRAGASGQPQKPLGQQRRRICRAS